jgi:itaconate CoA-transferase
VSIAAPPVLSSDGPRELGPVPAVGEHSAIIRAEFATG